MRARPPAQRSSQKSQSSHLTDRKLDTAETPIHARFDRSPCVLHSWWAVVVLHRVIALTLSLMLVAGNAALCAGWARTSEARMSCCLDPQTCPMHKGESHDSGAKRVVSQQQADSCCATSEQRQASQPDLTLLTVVPGPVHGSGVAVATSDSTSTANRVWRSIGPVPIPAVPRHVLLSVFLV